MSPVAVVAEEGPAIGAPVVGSTGAAPANTDEGGGGAAELPFPSAISLCFLELKMTQAPGDIWAGYST